MRLSQLWTFFLATSTITAASLKEESASHVLSAGTQRSEILSPDHVLERRKGGGGKGGGGGGGGGGKSGGGGGTGRTSPSSNSGGSTRQGSGPTRSYGGGGYYGGGASTPYKSGGKTPNGLFPGVLIGSAAALVIFPGIWLYSAYPYYYSHPYHFYNSSFQNATQQGLNETLPVVCLCEENSVCGCDENNDQSYLNDLVGNGSYAALNKTLVTVSEVNDTLTRALVLNGTLPNGTTAPGGTDDDESAAARLASALPFGRFTGYYAMGAIALYAVVLL